MNTPLGCLFSYFFHVFSRVKLAFLGTSNKSELSCREKWGKLDHLDESFLAKAAHIGHGRRSATTGTAAKTSLDLSLAQVSSTDGLDGHRGDASAEGVQTAGRGRAMPSLPE